MLISSWSSRCSMCCCTVPEEYQLRHNCVLMYSFLFVSSFQFLRIDLAMLRLALVRIRQVSSSNLRPETIFSVLFFHFLWIPVWIDRSPLLCMTTNTSFIRKLQWRFTTSSWDRLLLNKSRINAQLLRLWNVGWIWQSICEQWIWRDLEGSKEGVPSEWLMSLQDSNRITATPTWLLWAKKGHRLSMVRGWASCGP